MIKFFKIKDSEIRRAVEVDEAGNKVRVIAIIGQVKELLAKNVIFEDSTNGNMEKWLVIYENALEITTDYNSLAEAKASVKA